MADEGVSCSIPQRLLALNGGTSPRGLQQAGTAVESSKRSGASDERGVGVVLLSPTPGVWSALPLRFTGGPKQKPGRVSGEPAALCVDRSSEDLSNVVLTASGADVAGEYALVLVACGGGDLGGVVAVAGGLCGVSRAQRMTLELAWVKAGGFGAFLDDQSDALGCKRARDRAGAGAAPEPSQPRTDKRVGRSTDINRDPTDI
jgi:hypothetical protein